MRLRGHQRCSELVPDSFWHEIMLKDKIFMFCIFFNIVVPLNTHSGSMDIDGYQGFQWILKDFEDFEDFMKSPSAIMTGTPIWSCVGTFFPSKTNVSEAFEQV